MREQLLELAYDKQDEVFANSERDEFDCLIAPIEDGSAGLYQYYKGLLK